MLKLSETATIPLKAYGNDAGIDLFCNKDTTVPPYGSALIPTGISVAIPKGYCLIIKDKSGFVTKTRCCVVAGVIDEQYRGEIMIALENHSEGYVSVSAGQKIAQALLIEVPVVEIEEVFELPETQRGTGGFGSTGQ